MICQFAFRKDSMPHESAQDTMIRLGYPDTGDGFMKFAKEHPWQCRANRKQCPKTPGRQCISRSCVE
jgi:hypothetical protein